MTVEIQDTVAVGLGNGSATVFSFNPISVFANSELVVTLVTAAGVETLLSEGTGAAAYSVTISSLPGTGSITYPEDEVTPIDNGVKVVMKRILVLEQQTNLRNQGGYFPNVQEAVFDKLTMIAMQQGEEIDRSVKFRIGDTTGITSVELPVPVADETFQWDPTAKFLISAPSPAAAAIAAALSEANAMVSEANAAVSETNAATSETNAATSASGASTSATNAATSETNAATSASNASTSETNAATSETNAAASESAASTSESNAALSSSNAATAETNAETAETNAAASASAASTAQTAAETAQTAAETAQTAAETALDEFDDRYLGSKTSNPTLDNDGNALLTGALYFNSTSDEMLVYDGAAWASINILTNAQIAAAVEAASNSNTFNDADHSKLNGIASGANVGLLPASNLSDLGSAGTGRTNLGVAYASKANMEAEAANKVVTPDIAKGAPSAAKCWGVYDQTGTPAIKASYNVASINDDATGKFTVTIGTDFSGIEYAAIGMSLHTIGSDVFSRHLYAAGTPAAGTFKFITGAGSAEDLDRNYFSMFGDQ